MSIEIREITIAEAYAVSVLAREIWQEHYNPMVGSAQVEYMLSRFQSAEAVLSHISTEGYRYHAAYDGDRLIGYSAFYPADGYIFLSKLYVLKEYRGQGIAGRFFDIIKDASVTSGYNKIVLRVNRHNSGSIAVYKKWGFAVAKEEINDIGGGFINEDYVLEFKT